jgi:heavy-metal resistance protein
VRRWWLVIALLLSVGLNLGILAAIAARRAGPPPQRPPKEDLPNPPAGGDPLALLPRLADRLGLEGEDRRKFLDIQLDLYRETSRLRVQLGEVHREVRREMTRDQPDRQRVERLLSGSAQTYLALERSLATHVLSTRDLLDADQRRQYLALVGRLRVANPGPGLGMGPGRLGPPDSEGTPRPLQEMRQQRRQEFLEELRDRQRLRQERRRDGFPGRRFPGRRQPGGFERVPP